MPYPVKGLNSNTQHYRRAIGRTPKVKQLPPLTAEDMMFQAMLPVVVLRTPSPIPNFAIETSEANMQNIQNMQIEREWENRPPLPGTREAINSAASLILNVIPNQSNLYYHARVNSGMGSSASSTNNQSKSEDGNQVLQPDFMNNTNSTNSTFYMDSNPFQGFQNPIGRKLLSVDVKEVSDNTASNILRNIFGKNYKIRPQDIKNIKKIISLEYSTSEGDKKKSNGLNNKIATRAFDFHLTNKAFIESKFSNSTSCYNDHNTRVKRSDSDSDSSEEDYYCEPKPKKQKEYSAEDEEITKHVDSIFDYSSRFSRAEKLDTVLRSRLNDAVDSGNMQAEDRETLMKLPLILDDLSARSLEIALNDRAKLLLTDEEFNDECVALYNLETDTLMISGNTVERIKTTVANKEKDPKKMDFLKKELSTTIYHEILHRANSQKDGDNIRAFQPQSFESTKANYLKGIEHWNNLMKSLYAIKQVSLDPKNKDYAVNVRRLAEIYDEMVRLNSFVLENRIHILAETMSDIDAGSDSEEASNSKPISYSEAREKIEQAEANPTNEKKAQIARSCMRRMLNLFYAYYKPEMAMFLDAESYISDDNEEEEDEIFNSVDKILITDKRYSYRNRNLVKELTANLQNYFNSGVANRVNPNTETYNSSPFLPRSLLDMIERNFGPNGITGLGEYVEDELSGQYRVIHSIGEMQRQSSIISSAVERIGTPEQRSIINSELDVESRMSLLRGRMNTGMNIVIVPDREMQRLITSPEVQQDFFEGEDIGLRYSTMEILISRSSFDALTECASANGDRYPRSVDEACDLTKVSKVLGRLSKIIIKKHYIQEKRFFDEVSRVNKYSDKEVKEALTEYLDTLNSTYEDVQERRLDYDTAVAIAKEMGISNDAIGVKVNWLISRYDSAKFKEQTSKIFEAEIRKAKLHKSVGVPYSPPTWARYAVDPEVTSKLNEMKTENSKYVYNRIFDQNHMNEFSIRNLLDTGFEPSFKEDRKRYIYNYLQKNPKRRGEIINHLKNTHPKKYVLGPALESEAKLFEKSQKAERGTLGELMYYIGMGIANSAVMYFGGSVFKRDAEGDKSDKMLLQTYNRLFNMFPDHISENERERILFNLTSDEFKGLKDAINNDREIIYNAGKIYPQSKLSALWQSCQQGFLDMIIYAKGMSNDHFLECYPSGQSVKLDSGVLASISRGEEDPDLIRGQYCYDYSKPEGTNARVQNPKDAVDVSSCFPNNKNYTVILSDKSKITKSVGKMTEFKHGPKPTKSACTIL